jgi:hypothetical protein
LQGRLGVLHYAGAYRQPIRFAAVSDAEFVEAVREEEFGIGFARRSPRFELQ